MNSSQQFKSCLLEIKVARVTCKTKSENQVLPMEHPLFNSSVEDWNYYIYRMAMAPPPAKQPGSAYELQMD